MVLTISDLLFPSVHPSAEFILRGAERAQDGVCVYPTIDPSVALRTPVLAGLNYADRVLGDKEGRVTEIFLK